jgi:hypothetical protein
VSPVVLRNGHDAKGREKTTSPSICCPDVDRVISIEGGVGAAFNAVCGGRPIKQKVMKARSVKLDVSPSLWCSLFLGGLGLTAAGLLTQYPSVAAIGCLMLIIARAWIRKDR